MNPAAFVADLEERVTDLDWLTDGVTVTIHKGELLDHRAEGGGVAAGPTDLQGFLAPPVEGTSGTVRQSQMAIRVCCVIR